MQDPEDLFHLWYVNPLKTLESEIGADAGFIAISISCFLYERYATAVLEQRSTAGAKTKQEIQQQLARDFEIDERTANYFWDVIRNGLLHGGMPKQRDRKKDLPRWVFSQSFDKPIEMADREDDLILKIQPWLFTHKVLNLWKADLDLLEQSRGFPWANIEPLASFITDTE
jgi:hypothetical protein